MSERNGEMLQSVVQSVMFNSLHSYSDDTHLASITLAVPGHHCDMNMSPNTIWLSNVFLFNLEKKAVTL